jgi:hypothetical protein
MRGRIPTTPAATSPNTWRGPGPPAGGRQWVKSASDGGEVTLVDLAVRLARIERLLTTSTTDDQ